MTEDTENPIIDDADSVGGDRSEEASAADTPDLEAATLGPDSLEPGEAGPADPGSPDVEPPDNDLIGTVAIVGFPNVGKSTLINRLTSTRAAVVHETSGTTRDRKELVCDWAGKRFLLIDTGGVDIASNDAVSRSIVEQARHAIAEADLVLLVVDAKAGATTGDAELADIVRMARKPVMVLANKIDDPSQEPLALEFHRLGLGDPIPLSGMHGTNTGDLLDDIVERLEDVGEARHTVGDSAIRVAILGRPNVGKSSLFNALIGVERTIVSEVPGTTRDSIDTILEREGRTFQLIDTAGLRRKRKQRQGIEYYSELRALEAAERADVALVLIDSGEGIVEGDLHAADIARKAQCSTLVVLSKWDLSTITIEDVRPQLLRRLRQRPPFITTSATTGRGIVRVLDKVGELYDKHASRISTGELNRFLGELKEARQPPSKGRKRLNLLYGAQVTSRPPRFRFTVNDTSLVTRDYAYWVENELRERYAMEGVPVTIDFRRRS
ncbi:MAG TPA: ribosome biogenesis GTPase Der [Gaiellaceae bacterium]